MEPLQCTEANLALPFSLHLIAALSDLARIRGFVEETALALGVLADTVPMIVLAVDEGVTNILVHGYHRRPGPVEVDIGLVEGALMIRLRDRARPFDPTTVPPPDLVTPLARRKPGGLGVHLMRSVVDELVYRRQPGDGNELMLIKHMAQEAPVNP